jgi:hypothetical protein
MPRDVHDESQVAARDGEYLSYDRLLTIGEETRFGLPRSTEVKSEIQVKAKTCHLTHVCLLFKANSFW